MSLLQKSLLVFLLLPTSCYQASSVSSPESTPSALTAGAVIQKQIAQGERQAYRIELSAQQYFRVHLKHSGIKLKIIFADVAGRPLRTMQVFQPGTIPFSTVVSTPGPYQLEVQSLEEAPYTGSYNIQLLEQRTAQLTDTKRVEADTAFVRAEGNRAEATHVALIEATRNYQTAQTIWNELGENKETAAVLLRLGVVQMELAEDTNDKAKQSFSSALSLYDPEQEEALESQNHRASFMREKSETLQRWLEQSRAKGFKRAEALTLDNLGELAFQSDPQRARQYYSQSFSLWEQLKDRQRQALSLQNCGATFAYYAETLQALDYYQKALILYRSINDKNGQITNLTLMGNLQSLLGNKQAALKFYEEAEAAAAGFGSLKHQMRILNGKGFVYDSFGEYANALKLYEQALEITRQIQDVKNQSGSLLNIGDMYRQLGQPQQALAHFQASIKMIREMKNSLYLPPALHNLGLTYEAMGKQELALATLREASQLSEQTKNLRRAAKLHNEMGRIYHAAHRLPEARQHLTQALQFAQQVDEPFSATQAHYHLARVEQASGNTVAALQQIQAALGLIEKSRNDVMSPSLRVSYLASVHQSYELSVELFMQRQREAPQENYAAEALALSEQSRARGLLDLLNEARHDIERGIDPKLLDQARSLQQTRSKKADQLLQLTGHKEKEAEFLAVTKEVEDLSMKLNQINSKIRETNPQYLALTQPQLLKAPEIQQLLDDNTLLLEYALGDENSYLWAVTNHSIETYKLPKRATIEAKVQEVYQLMTAFSPLKGETSAQWTSRIKNAHQQYWPRAAQLSQMILGPAAAQLQRNRLLIVGDGALQLLPFAALPVPEPHGNTNAKLETSNAKPLIVEHEITTIPSASSLKLLREEPVKPPPSEGRWTRWMRALRGWWNPPDKASSAYAVAVLADPVFGKDDKRIRDRESIRPQTNQPQMRDVNLADNNAPLPRLIATREEAAEIQKSAQTDSFVLKQGFEVNRQLLEGNELNRYSIIHLATHGFWDSNNPELSGIFLSRVDSQGNNVDGILRLSDIYNLKWPKELVVLSACETAVGTDIRGEGLIALTRGFMYAGAARVMASLWKVEDTATAEMMKVFYQRLLQDKLSPAAALRQAQISMWQKAPSRSPYNWAAFVIQGEYR